MTPEERFERIESNLEEVSNNLAIVTRRQEEMAARQQYHDEAFERMDAGITELRESIHDVLSTTKALSLIAANHERRIEGLEGDNPRPPAA